MQTPACMDAGAYVIIIIVMLNTLLWRKTILYDVNIIAIIATLKFHEDNILWIHSEIQKPNIFVGFQFYKVPNLW